MWQYRSPGIPDEQFLRGKIPMTKQEVRVVTLAKARLQEDSIVYDIGAGTGSLTIEAALMAPKGKVYAVEREAEGLELIARNCTLFGVNNVEIINGTAPAAMQGLPQAHNILIGGSGGNLAQIIAVAAKSLRPGGRLVINAVTLETLAQAQNMLKSEGFSELEIVSLAITRWPVVGRSHMAQALNQVFIISAAWPDYS
ncbi:MAG: precorrin-6Y C5,15-methyltransferase (decarboxylating) subunit CbiT [Peptococcaceae bacterium]|nr:precorrin-6Y C5,15-methyltransferase (decarboxylating) subunit CbiT [Peptococcaceae bacterium]